MDDLTEVGLVALDAVLAHVEAGRIAAPITAAALAARGLGGVWRPWMASLDRAATIALLRVAIAERIRPATRSVELVWTGPEAKVSTARDTAVVVRELFGRAQSNVLVAGFSFSSGASIFEPLSVAMRDRGVEARLFLHLDDIQGMTPEQSVANGVQRFLSGNWTFEGQPPAIYYDPRTVAPGSSINLHAKCVVVDDRWVLIGSANFTHNAHARNIEVGVVLDDPTLAISLGRQWQGLVDGGLVRQAHP